MAAWVRRPENRIETPRRGCGCRSLRKSTPGELKTVVTDVTTVVYSTIQVRFRDWSGDRIHGPLRVFAHDPDAVFEHIHSHVGFVLGHDQGRTDPDGAWTAAQKQNAALEGQLDDAVAIGGAILLGDFVLHDFDADHQAAAAYVAHQLQL